VSHLNRKTISYGNLSLISKEMIIDPYVVENTIDTYYELTTLIAQQFFGNFILTKEWADYW
jgi:hypothetical protein